VNIDPLTAFFSITVFSFDAVVNKAVSYLHAELRSFSYEIEALLLTISRREEILLIWHVRKMGEHPILTVQLKPFGRVKERISILPLPHQTVREVFPHTAYRGASPKSMRFPSYM
jgi:hypothetical protein